MFSSHSNSVTIFGFFQKVTVIYGRPTNIVPQKSHQKISKRFYVRALGLKITKETPDLVTLAGVLALSSRGPSRDQHVLQSGALEAEPMHVYIETKDLDAAHRNVRNASTTRLSDITCGDNRRHFTCTDPDGNLVEVFESRT
jgi:catechol 2,3-dioxygenase-like lactoylglutathione lyase family enzyme